MRFEVLVLVKMSVVVFLDDNHLQNYYSVTVQKNTIYILNEYIDEMKLKSFISCLENQLII